MANVCLSCGSLGLVCKGCGSAGVCATRAVHKPICNSHLQGHNIPVPGEGSFAQMIPTTCILCWLTQGGAGQSAASPGAWKKPRCQSWCENMAQSPPVLLLQPWPLSPALPQVLHSRAKSCRSCQSMNTTGRALSTADICSSRDSETKDPADKGTPSPHGPGH